MASKPKGPSKEEKAAAEQLQASQAEQLAELDSEENTRIKKLIMGGRGSRGYRGAPMFRARPSDTASGRAATGGANPRGASAGGSNGVVATLLRSAGGRGGRSGYGTVLTR